MISSEFRNLWKQLYNKTYSEKEDISCGVYVGYMQIEDTISKPKIGQCKHLTALARGRSQGGADWHFAYFFPTNTPQQAKEIEKDLHVTLKDDRIQGNQGQKELYDMSVEECVSKVKLHIDEHYLEYLNEDQIFRLWSKEPVLCRKPTGIQVNIIKEKQEGIIPVFVYD